VADDKDKKTSLKEKVGLFIDKKLTFGGGLSVSQKIIDAAEEAVGVDSYKDIETQAQFDKFKKIMNQMAQQERQGETPAKGASGGMVKKFKNGGSVEGKRLTRTVPPKKGPNSQGMRGTGIAIRGTSFKGVF
jgi:hypothetical protein|tara:strand:+ start:111 stop:506 length:396 start_codon:yes stop_codon:yes gene_type:complete